MGKSTPPDADRAAELIDEIGAANRVLWRSQARQAALMVEFCDARKAADKQIITESRITGADPMFKAGEFAASEVSLAVKTSKFITQRTIAMTRRVQSEAPDVWDAWEHGDIDNDKVVRVNRALRRLVHDRSKELLNTLVVPVAIEKTPEILGRWLNQFIAEVEPDETDERLRRSFDDRYVSVRPDIDGISVLHAALSSVDAVAVDQILNALACIAEPGDERTKQQRRADALVDLLCGRISNGWHTGYDTTTGYDTNTDTDDHLDDNPPNGANTGESDKAGGNNPSAAGGHQSGQSGAGLDPANGESDPAHCVINPPDGVSGPFDDEPGPADSESDPAHCVINPPDGEFSPAEAGPAHVKAEQPDNATAVDLSENLTTADVPGTLTTVDRTCGPADAEALPPAPAGDNAVAADWAENVSVLDLPENLTAVDRTWNLTAVDPTENHLATDGAGNGDGDVPGERLPENVQPAAGTADDRPLDPTVCLTDQPWDANDWDLPATAFRPDPHAPVDPAAESVAASAPDLPIGTDPHPARLSTPPPAVQPRPPAVTIGVVVTAQSLFGYSNMPGQLVDRSSLVPADTVRDLAQQPGTLFYRLLTDQTGKLLDVTEMGRFPSRKLDTAVKFRTGICGQPSCHHPADRCDLDHLTPVPEGATTGSNLAPACRHDHRAKTHAGHATERIGPGATRWTTPTGHAYLTNDQPFPVDQWPETG